MAEIINSLRKLVVLIVVIGILAVAMLAVFDVFVAAPINLSQLLREAGEITIGLIFFLTAIYFLRRVKPLLTPHIGVQGSTILQFILSLIMVLILAFFLLSKFPGIDISTLIASAGIISITIGLIVSTFAGGLLSGALVFTTYQFKIGDDVMVNNMPGKVTDITALVTRIRTDMGQITIPNSAIASGGVIITAIRRPEAEIESRLRYSVGDRVATSYRNEEGTVKEITAFHTTILLDSGREITYLNNSILSGAVVVAKLTGQPSSK